MSQATKTVIQCDFDGTVTEDDTSFLLLDAFARGNWCRVLDQYKKHRISVGQFNRQVFATVKADEHTLLRALKGKVKIRDGFHELADYCSKQGFRLVIISNGLEFYIKATLEEIGLENVEAHAAQVQFDPLGMKVRYMGPDGQELDDGFKEAYVELFLRQGYKVIYVGNGDSDIIPAQHAHRIFARGELLTYCRTNNLGCNAFDSFTDVIREMSLRG